MQDALWLGSDGEVSVQQVKAPTRPSANHVLVRVRSCCLSSIDGDVARSHYKDTLGPQERSHGLGTQFAGDVVLVGPECANVKQGDAVVGILPLHMCGACTSLLSVSELYIAALPESVGYEAAASTILPAVYAITALKFGVDVSRGDSILVTRAFEPKARAVLELALHWDLAVMASVPQLEDVDRVPRRSELDLVVNEQATDLHTAVMEHTHGVGVNVIADTDARIVLSTEARHQRLRSLSPHGKWILSCGTQLDPPDIAFLTLKNASVSFCSEQMWLTAGTQAGRYLHLLHECVHLIAEGVFTPLPGVRVDLDHAASSFATLPSDFPVTSQAEEDPHVDGTGVGRVMVSFANQ